MFHVEHCSRTTQGGTGPEEVRSNLPEPTPPALVSLTAPHYAAGSKALSGARKMFHVEHCLICEKLGLHPEVESNRHGANAIFSRARSLSAADWIGSSPSVPRGTLSRNNPGKNRF